MPQDESKHVKLYNQNATVDGKTIEDWSEDWLRWVFHAPALTPPGTPFGAAGGNPEASPANALIENDNSIFFLYGGDWGNQAHPAIPIIYAPAYKPILVPLINAFDIEGPGIETIAPSDANPNVVSYHDSGRGSYADEARYITDLAKESIYEAHLTVTKPGDTKPLLDVHWPASARFEQDTGTFALGDPQAGDYLASLVGTDSRGGLPFTEEVGVWAMIQGLTPGDYIINFGGTGHAVVDPVSGLTIFAEGWGANPSNNTTDLLRIS